MPLPKSFTILPENVPFWKDILLCDEGDNPLDEGEGFAGTRPGDDEQWPRSGGNRLVLAGIGL